MAATPAIPVLHYWYMALSSPFGVELLCSDAEAVRQRLYKARKEAGDADLEQVAVCMSPFDPQKIWLVRRKPTDETT